jgi:EAL domain-containing protein (putative c-di-GMP-specific phosphodiesterase class I)
VSLAERLRIGVVAEGVETETEAAELLRIGCYRAQGHLLSEPLPAEYLGPLIREGKLGGHAPRTFTLS